MSLDPDFSATAIFIIDYRSDSSKSEIRIYFLLAACCYQLVIVIILANRTDARTKK